MHGLRSQAQPAPRTPTEKAIETLFEIGLAFHRGQEYTFDPEFCCQGMDADEMNRIVNDGLITESKMHFVAEGYKHLIAWRILQDMEMFERLKELEPESFRLATERMAGHLPRRPPKPAGKKRPKDNGNNVPPANEDGNETNSRLEPVENGGVRTTQLNDGPADAPEPNLDDQQTTDVTPARDGGAVIQLNDGSNHVPEQIPDNQRGSTNNNCDNVTRMPSDGDGGDASPRLHPVENQVGGAETIDAPEQITAGIGISREVTPRSVGGSSPSRWISLDHADLEAHMRSLGLWRDRRPPPHTIRRPPPQRPTNNVFGDIAPNPVQQLQSPATGSETRNQNPQTKIRLVRGPGVETGSLLDMVNVNPMHLELSPIHHTPAQTPGPGPGGSFDDPVPLFVDPVPSPNGDQTYGQIKQIGPILPGSGLDLEHPLRYPPRSFKTLKEMIADDIRSSRSKILRMKPVFMPQRQPQIHPELEMDDMWPELDAHYQIIFDAARNGKSDIPFGDFVHGSDAERLRQERALVSMISDGVIELVDNQTMIRIIQPLEESLSDHSSTDDDDVDLQGAVGGRDSSEESQ